MLRTILAVVLAGATQAQLVCDVVKRCGADPTNSTDSTKQVQQCVRLCLPGGELVFPANAAIKTGSLNFTGASNLVVSFGENSTLTAINEQGMYPLEPALPPQGSLLQYRGFIAGSYLRNVTFQGPTSARIEGSGWPWWQNYTKKLLTHQRPKLFELQHSQDVHVLGLTFQNSPFWSVVPWYSKNLVFRGVTVLAPRPVGNTDGIDPDACQNVLIDSCHVDVGDDGISIKADPLPDGSLMPATNITILSTTILSRNFAIGSACYGNVTNITMIGGRIGDDGDAQGVGSAAWAVKIKSHSPGGGIVDGVTFDSVRFGRLTPNSYQQPNGGYVISMYMTYGDDGGKEDKDEEEVAAMSRGRDGTGVVGPGAPTTIRNVVFRNITTVYARTAPEMAGQAGEPIEGLTFDGFVMLDVKEPEWRCSHVTNTTLIGDVVPRPAPGTCGT